MAGRVHNPQVCRRAGTDLWRTHLAPATCLRKSQVCRCTGTDLWRTHRNSVKRVHKPQVCGTSRRTPLACGRSAAALGRRRPAGSARRAA
ncbi:hypothetical protein PSCLAVI8L_30013 [Pseudoclavibacter sp. 8L]|nr:hypothetical protein PSCLAVI8L_30013 [Pseudoclavibacter sp. 8L]